MYLELVHECMAGVFCGIGLVAGAGAKRVYQLTCFTSQLVKVILVGVRQLKPEILQIFAPTVPNAIFERSRHWRGASKRTNGIFSNPKRMRPDTFQCCAFSPKCAWSMLMYFGGYDDPTRPSIRFSFGYWGSLDSGGPLMANNHCKWIGKVGIVLSPQDLFCSTHQWYLYFCFDWHDCVSWAGSL